MNDHDMCRKIIESGCSGIRCTGCPLDKKDKYDCYMQGTRDAAKLWLKEHPEPIYKTEVEMLNEMDNKVYVTEIDNILDDKFTVDQKYFFPINNQDDDSVTVMRMVIPAGTPWRDGYAEIRNVLSQLGYDPEEIADKLEIPEIMAGASDV